MELYVTNYEYIRDSYNNLNCCCFEQEKESVQKPPEVIFMSRLQCKNVLDF